MSEEPTEEAQKEAPQEAQEEAPGRAFIAPEALRTLAPFIEDAFAKDPPTIAVIGLSGVGKTSLINTLFGTKRDVSATTRGTTRFHKRDFTIQSRRVQGVELNCVLRIIDAPGLGEDSALDQNYLRRYRTHLPEADVAIWVLAARNRALALDQQYLHALSGVLENVVFCVNQVDLVDPLPWNEALNLPSEAQKANIETILADRSQKLEAALNRPAPCIGVSAHRHFNLQSFFRVCLDHAPPGKRWMFEILKGFSTRDWLDGAQGLSKRQREALEAKYFRADAALDLNGMPFAF